MVLWGLVLVGDWLTLLPAAQRTNALTYGVVGRTWAAAGRELECQVHHQKRFLKKNEFPRVKNRLHTLPGTTCWWRVDPYNRSGPESPAVPGGEKVLQGFFWVGDWVTFLPVAQQTNALTYGTGGGTSKPSNIDRNVDQL